jgi:hypothetical protein
MREIVTARFLRLIALGALLPLAAPALAEAPRTIPTQMARMLKAHHRARTLVEGLYAPLPASTSLAQRSATRDLQLVLEKAVSGPRTPRLVRLHAKSRKAFNVPDYTSSCYSTRLQGFGIHFDQNAAPNINEQGAKAMRSGRASLSKLGPDYIMLADDKARELDTFSNFVHEASHLRFAKYLDNRIDRLATAFPSYIRKSGGSYSMKNTLYHLLTEWYAWEMGYRAYEIPHGAALAKGGGPPEGYGANLSEPRSRQQAIVSFVDRGYKIDDPALLNLARGKTLGEFLKYGEHGSREAYSSTRAQKR